MSSIIVLGATTFIGFHISQKLIEKEQEVLAIDFKENLTEAEEERLMMIGRNSFFQYDTLKNIEDKLENDSYEALFICVDKKWSEEEKAYMELLFSKAQRVIQLVNTINDEKKKINIDMTTVLLPQIFGPYLEGNNPISKAIVNMVENKETDKVELAKEEYLYVENAVEALIALMEENIHEDILYIAATEKNSWDVVSAELNTPIGEKLESKNGGEKVIWDYISKRATISIKEGLHLQKEFEMLKLRNKRIIE